VNRIVTVGVAAIGFTLAVPQIAYASTSPQPTATYTMAQVATHKTAGDCWSAVGGGVYNLTTWLPTHTTTTITVTSVCGVDSSALFGVSPASARFDDDANGSDDNGSGGEDRSVVRQTKAKSTHAATHHSNNGRRDHGRGHGRGQNALLQSIQPFRIGHLAPTAVTTPGTVTPPPVTPPTTTYTLAQVQTHNVATNCWTAINGKVYNLTSFISSHPGGPAAITGLCGTDGTAAFTGKHGTQSNPTSVLA
jgi:cytochrome b involved in lipid metabolism